MRTSPASHLSQSHAATHAAQTNHNNKADETSPFGQLMDSVAPQDKQDKKVTRNDPRTEKPAEDRTTDVPQETQAKAAPQDEKPVAGDKPETHAEEAPATEAAQDADQTVTAQTGDASQVAQPTAQPAPQAATAASASLLALLNGTGDAALPQDAATQTQAAAAPVAQVAAAPAGGTSATATAAAPQAAAPAGAEAGAEPAATAEAKTADAAQAPTADQKPQAEIAALAANDNAAPESPQAKAAATAVNAEQIAKPAPQAASTNMALQAPIQASVQPQAAAANANNPAAQGAQHVEVSATPKPNLTSLAVEISAKSQSGAKQFDIRLDPPELGRVEVRLSIDSAGKASAHLSADQPQTLDLLQKDASVLTRALRDAGLDMSQASLNFSLRQQAQGQQGGEQRGHGRAGRNHLTATQAIEASSASATYRANGGVDIRV